MEGLERFDNFLITIVNETGGVEGLLHSLFSFLYRRTDFYYEMLPGEKMGFLPGEAERMVATTFKQYQNMYFKKHPPKDPKEVQKKIDELKRKNEEAKAREAEAKTSAQTHSETPKEATFNPTSKTVQAETSGKVTQASTPSQAQPQPDSSTQPKKVDPKFANISTHNGGKNEKYSWSQGIHDLLVQIDLEKPTKSKDLDVTLENKHVKIVHKATKKTLLEGEFYDSIKVEDSTWSIEEGLRLILNLEKATENIWKIVIKGDPEIDATKVDNTKSLDDFDPETQGALRKIVYEQNRKAQGLPTTEEEKQMEMIRKAWDAEGSPFKGQPFDPSRLNLPQFGQNLGKGPDVFSGK
jgi:hypothetical protein